MTRKKRNLLSLYILLAIGIVILAGGSFIIAKKYAPTKERMDLSEVYGITYENQAAVIIDGVFAPYEENSDHADGIMFSGVPYLELRYLKSSIDNAYVYDDSEGILRYATDTDIVTVVDGDTSYSVGRSATELGVSIIEHENGAVYIALPFVKLYSDISYTLAAEPDRIIIEKAGWEKTSAAAKKNTEIRRLGGPKSKILADVKKGDKLIITEEVGKWTGVMSEDGVIGYVQDSTLAEKESTVVEATLPERNYRHILMDEDVSMGWFQVMNAAGNSAMREVLDRAGDSINVISPTWFRLSDNKGGITNIASFDCVNECHSRGIQVWALVNNFDNLDVDSSTVLSSTSARDNLINNLIGAAVAYDLDGINVDFEYLQESDADGFLEFIRELSIKCENNDLVISVDNYVPSSFHAFYDYAEQGKYVDYVAIMAYDEHYSGSDDPGSVASIGFVEKGVTDMMEYVPANQIILGMPFYYRVWVTDSTGLTSMAVHMDGTKELLEKYDATTTWLEDVGQSYSEFEYDGAFYQIWIEDTKSLGLKLSVMRENDLAGAAYWKLGAESAAVWDVVDEYMR